MTYSLTRLKLLTASMLAISVSACSTAPQEGVVATDLSGTFSQMWSGVFSGELRPAPQPSYSFGASQDYGPQYALGAHDATLNTQRLMRSVSYKAAAQPVFSRRSAPQRAQEQFSQNFVPQRHIEPRRLTAPQQRVPALIPSQQHSNRFASYTSKPLKPNNQFTLPRQNVPAWDQRPLIQRPQSFDAPVPVIDGEPHLTPKVKKRSFGARLKSIFKPRNTSGYISDDMRGFETLTPKRSVPLPQKEVMALPPRPAQSQPITAEPNIMRDAYPAHAAVTAPAELETSAIPPLASFKDNTAFTNSAPADDWQSPRQDSGDSLSYVKMGGGSQIADWQSCEKQAGGYFIATATGFIVEPKFDSCMRTMGYKPESEAEAQLSALAAVKTPRPKTELAALKTREVDTNAIPSSRRYPSRARRGS